MKRSRPVNTVLIKTRSRLRLAWQRVGTFIHPPGTGRQGTTYRMFPINPADLDAALETDHNQS